MHWKDIVVKQYADIEEQIRIGPYRANFAKHYVASNGDVKTLIGEAGRDHEVRSYSYEEVFNDKTTTIAASDSVSVGSTLTTSVAGTTTATFGNNVTSNITGSLAVNASNRFDILGHNGTIGNYTTVNTPAAYISFNTLMESNVEVGGGIEIDGDTSIYAKADDISVKASEAMTLASEGTFNIERKYGISALSAGDIVMHNYNGDILLDAKAKASSSAAAATTGGTAEFAKAGYIILRTNESFTKRITISESASIDSQNPSRTRIEGIEMRADNSRINLIIGTDSAQNAQGLFIGKFSNEASISSACDRIFLNATTSFNLATTGTLAAGISTNLSTNTLAISSNAHIDITASHAGAHINLAAEDIRLATKHLILDNASTTGAVYGTGNPTGTATEGRIYFKIIS
jgi:hypothetical protein